jgi:hypothetical protein
MANFQYSLEHTERFVRDNLNSGRFASFRQLLLNRGHVTFSRILLSYYPPSRFGQPPLTLPGARASSDGHKIAGFVNGRITCESTERGLIGDRYHTEEDCETLSRFVKREM